MLDEADVGLFAAGVAARIQVPGQVEANALYWSESYRDDTLPALSLPIIARPVCAHPVASSPPAPV